MLQRAYERAKVMAKDGVVSLSALDEAQKNGGHSDDSTAADSRRDFSEGSDLRGDFDKEFLFEVL